MSGVYFIGLDIAKNFFQVFLADQSGREISNKKIRRDNILNYFANLEPCVIGLEACGSAHHWARKLLELGHTVKMIAPNRVKAFLGHRNKTDAADARAICEALRQPDTRFVPIKTESQQDADHLLARRARLVAERTQVVNQTRSFLAERGWVFPIGIGTFVKNIRELCAEKWDEFSDDFQHVLEGNIADYMRISESIATLDKLIAEKGKEDATAKALMSIPGIGHLIAFALLAKIGDISQFQNGRQLAAYFGLTPKEYSSGGKRHLSGITKRGDRTVRTLLILAARAVMTGLKRRKKDENGLPARLSNLEKWIMALLPRLGVFKTAVAVANKLARIAWAIMSKGEIFNANKAAWEKTNA